MYQNNKVQRLSVEAFARENYLECRLCGIQVERKLFYSNIKNKTKELKLHQVTVMFAVHTFLYDFIIRSSEYSNLNAIFYL